MDWGQCRLHLSLCVAWQEIALLESCEVVKQLLGTRAGWGGGAHWQLSHMHKQLADCRTQSIRARLLLARHPQVQPRRSAGSTALLYLIPPSSIPLTSPTPVCGPALPPLPAVKAQRGQYTSPKEFKADLLLIVNNVSGGEVSGGSMGSALRWAAWATWAACLDADGERDEGHTLCAVQCMLCAVELASWFALLAACCIVDALSPDSMSWRQHRCRCSTLAAGRQACRCALPTLRSSFGCLQAKFYNESKKHPGELPASQANAKQSTCLLGSGLLARVLYERAAYATP